jgi:DNA polymerase-3 subunit alpha
MGCEFYRMGIESSPMSSMPVLDTCTEVTASLLKLPGGRGGKFKLPTLTELHQYFLTNHLQKHIMQLPMLKQQRAVFRINSYLKFLPKKNLMFQKVTFKIFKKKSKRVQLIGLKHINLKEASEQIRSNFKKVTSKRRQSQFLMQ